MNKATNKGRQQDFKGREGNCGIRRPIHLDAACEVIRGLMESFEQVAKEDHSGPVMEHSQQLYAGLTYGKGTLNEVSFGEGSTYGGKI